MSASVECLLASVRLLREEYEAALQVRRELIATRHRLATDIRMWARRECIPGMPPKVRSDTSTCAAPGVHRHAKTA